jgi:hypothetical protein
MAEPGGPTTTTSPAPSTSGAGTPFGPGVNNPAQFYRNFQNVVGQPHSFIESADPGQRTFVRHMLMTPPLVMIRPGRVKYTNTADLISVIQKNLGLSDPSEVEAFFKVGGASAGTVFDMDAGYGDGTDLTALRKAIAQKTLGTVMDFGKGGQPPVRYFEFEPKINEYASIVATMTARVYARMTEKGDGSLPWLNFDGAKPAASTYGGFTTYWADNSSSVSESASSSIGDTAVASMIKGIADKSRELQFLIGSDWSNEGDAASRDRNLAGGLAEMIGGRDSAVQASGVRAALGDAVLGINPLFPQVWKDSSFGRTYDLSFKFHSPYGAPGAIYQNVLLPFVQLLCLVLPVMRNPGTYSEPFVFQLDAPGHFSCDLGICESLSFVKGGSDHLWTKDGLPRQIDVTMSVKDLYPTLASSHNNKSLYLNVGMGTFLDNLAAINLFDSSQGLNPLTILQTNLQSAITMGRTKPDRLKADLTNMIFQAGSVANLFRNP